MKKLFIITGVICLLLFSYILIEQYRQYSVDKTNLNIMFANNSYIKDSVTFKVYIDDSLVVSCRKGEHPHPYYDKFGVKTGWGNHKITVVIDDGLVQRNFNIFILPVRYCMIYFWDKCDDETGEFKEFEIGVRMYSMIFRFMHLVG
jgi:hypothetical protein